MFINLVDFLTIIFEGKFHLRQGKHMMIKKELMLISISASLSECVHRIKNNKIKKSLTLILLLAVTFQALALTPPTKKQLDDLREKGELIKSIEYAKSLGNHKLSPFNQHVKHARQLYTAKTSSKANTIPGGLQSLQSIGSPKILVLLIEFPDYPKFEENDVAFYEERIFGEGDPNGNGNYPFDSLTNFYKRSSYGLLNIQGNVLDWYKPNYDRPLENGTNVKDVGSSLIKEAIEYHDALGHDFSQYDNDGDGDIDNIAVLWTGPGGSFASTWWGTYSPSFSDSDFTVDGKKLSGFTWQGATVSPNNELFIPRALAHETGHALGIPDFYDYEFKNGGVGTVDLMNGGGNDHNAFSKYLLGWITPDVVGVGLADIELGSSSSSPEALIVMPGADANTIFDEYFIVQLRDQNLNDQDMGQWLQTEGLKQGLLIWHVDARLAEGGANFKNSNTGPDDKLIRLVQADGLDEIERKAIRAEISDFFHTGDEFSPNSRTQSRNNAGLHTGVSITNMAISSDKAGFKVEIVDSVPDFQVSLTIDQLIRDKESIDIVALTPQDIDTLELFVDDQLIHNFESEQFNYVWDADLVDFGTREIEVKLTNKAGVSSTIWNSVANLGTEKSTLVVSLGTRVDDTNSDLVSIFNDAGINAFTTDFLPALSTDDFNLVVMSYGAFAGPLLAREADNPARINVARPAREDEIVAIQHYLDSGGSMLVEGDAVFSFSEDTGREAFNDALGVEVIHGWVEKGTIYGEASQITADMNTVTLEDYAYPDIIQISSIDTITLLTLSGLKWDPDANQNISVEGPCAFTTFVGTAKVAVASCLNRYLKPRDRAVLLNGYLAHFGIENRISINSAPTADAGSDQTVNEQTNVTLSGTGTDADGDELTYSWIQTGGTPILNLSGENTEEVSFTLADIDSDELVTFELTVSDGELETTDEVSINVIARINQAPTADAGSDQTVNEQTTVTLSGTGTDADGDALTYSWIQTAGTSVAITDADNATATFIAPEVNSTTTLTFELTVTDGDLSISDSVIVTVNNVITALPPVTESNSGSGGSFTFLSALLLCITFLCRRVVFKNCINIRQGNNILRSTDS
jgi:M6 family metalloprotease-like protein